MDYTARLWYLTRYPAIRLLEEQTDLPRRIALSAGAELAGSTGAEEAYIVSEGHVRILQASADGADQTVEVINRGEIVGSCFGRAARGAERAVVMDDCVVYRFDRRTLEARAVSLDLPPLDLARRAGWSVQRFEVPVAPFLFRPLEERLAVLLLRFSDPSSDRTGPGPAGGRPVPLCAWQLADLTAANRQLVRLLMDEWEARRWVRASRSAVEVCNPGALSAVLKSESNECTVDS